MTATGERKSFGEAKVAAALSCYDAGVKVPEICRRFRISERTFYLWRRQRGASPAPAGPGPDARGGP